MQKKILLCPELKRGSGTGHLIRCLSLRKKLNGKIYLENPEILKSSVPESFKIDRGNIITEYWKTEWDLIVLDRKETSLQVYKKYKDYGTVAGIDEGGESKNYLVYTVNTLPGIDKEKCANLSSIGFLEFPENRKKAVSAEFNNILVTFGGEDPENLSVKIINEILKSNIFRPENITVIRGFLFKKYNFPDNVKIIESPENLKEILYKYDLVFTSFGLTCYESLSAKVPVILLNPTEYHRKLSKKNMLPEIGLKKPDIKRLKKLLKNKEEILKPLKSVSAKIEKQKKLNEVLIKIANTKGPLKNKCPACNNELNPVTARFEYKSYFICRKCSVIYQINFSSSKIIYNKKYFEKEYLYQYGKTYLDDFNKIKELSKKRILNILRLINNKKNTEVLDIGCAYGPFLDACREKGMIPEGIDISADAVAYVNNELKIKCREIDFTDYKGIKKYDIITMWYTIEHFKELSEVLKKVNNYLKSNGVFAFSTPNAGGISGKKNLNNFLKNSPEDHFTVFSPCSIKRVLKIYGFRAIKTVITGHHPERFKENIKKNSILWNLISLISRLFKLGDTFEVYAVKKQEK